MIVVRSIADTFDDSKVWQIIKEIVKADKADQIPAIFPISTWKYGGCLFVEHNHENEFAWTTQARHS